MTAEARTRYPEGSVRKEVRSRLAYIQDELFFGGVFVFICLGRNSDGQFIRIIIK